MSLYKAFIYIHIQGVYHTPGVKEVFTGPMVMLFLKFRKQWVVSLEAGIQKF